MLAHVCSCWQSVDSSGASCMVLACRCITAKHLVETRCALCCVLPCTAQLQSTAKIAHSYSTGHNLAADYPRTASYPTAQRVAWAGSFLRLLAAQRRCCKSLMAQPRKVQDRVHSGSTAALMPLIGPMCAGSCHDSTTGTPKPLNPAIRPGAWNVCLHPCLC
jgi:hypothetical protein